MLQVVEIQGRAQTPRRLRQSEQKVRLLAVTRANPISNIDLCDLCMFNDDMGGRISLQSFSSIPPKLGQAHLQFSNFDQFELSAFAYRKARSCSEGGKSGLPVVETLGG